MDPGDVAYASLRRSIVQNRHELPTRAYACALNAYARDSIWLPLLNHSLEKNGAAQMYLLKMFKQSLFKQAMAIYYQNQWKPLFKHIFAQPWQVCAGSHVNIVSKTFKL